jgi:hypothetical protein
LANVLGVIRVGLPEPRCSVAGTVRRHDDKLARSPSGGQALPARLARRLRDRQRPVPDLPPDAPAPAPAVRRQRRDPPRPQARA